MIDGIEFEVINVGFAWSTDDAALNDAQRVIERMRTSRLIQGMAAMTHLYLFDTNHLAPSPPGLPSEGASVAVRSRTQSEASGPTVAVPDDRAGVLSISA